MYLLSSICSCPLTSTVNKASSGVIEIMNLKTVASHQSAVKFLKVGEMKAYLAPKCSKTLKLTFFQQKYL